MLWIWVMASCDVPVELDVDQIPSQVVVEGQLIFGDDLLPERQYIRLTWSKGFYEDGAPEPVSGASVWIVAGADSVRLKEQTSADSAGWYRASPWPISGQLGQTYRLLISVDNQQISAEDRLTQLRISVDSLVSRIDPVRFAELERNPVPPGSDDYRKYFQVYIYGNVIKNDDPSQLQYFQFKFYENDTIRNNDGRRVFVIDDRLFNGVLNGIPADGYFQENDLVKLEAYSLSPEAYIFYNDLNRNLNNDGGMFGPIPANLRTNVSTPAVGFFQVSMMQSDTISVR